MLIDVVLEMRSYIAHPYWPETNACIEIEKKSGVNRQRSDDKRVTALKAECQKQGVTYEEYLRMKERSKKQWYSRKNGCIFIPRHQIAGAIVQAIAGSPKALRGPFDQDNFRALVELGDFETTEKKNTSVFARFVKLDGSNQRSWQENEFLGKYLDEGEPFLATGKIGVRDQKHADVVRALLTKVLEDVGIGASRKMGFGRGRIKSYKVAA